MYDARRIGAGRWQAKERLASICSVICLWAATAGTRPGGVGPQGARGWAIAAQESHDSRPLSPSVSPRPLDSASILRQAQLDLRDFHRRYRIIVGQQAVTTPDFLCKHQVFPYCYGPENGRMPYGAPLAAIPMAYPTADPVIPRDLRKRVHSQYERAMRKLDDAQRKLPGDRWIVGQRVLHRIGDQ
jgi:hypothetical protein